jgi:hypothetical protein
MSPAQQPLTVEQGRAMVARARRYKVIEKVSIVVSGIAIPLFAVSYLELRDIDLTVLAGGEKRIPYFAYGAILMFVSGTALLFLMRHLIANISRSLAAEQKRRWAEGDSPLGDDAPSAAGTSADAAGEMGLDDPPAVAG